MMPWGHFLVAAIPFSLYLFLRHRTKPTGMAVLLLLLGTQFPDLVDKPLAWRFDVLVNGRIFMHSLVFALPISTLVLFFAWRSDQLQLGGVFVYGHLMHIVGDFYSVFLGSTARIPNNMFWPLLPHQPVVKPEFVEQPSLLVLSTWDLVLIVTGAVLVGYACLDVARAAYGYSSSS
jgi:hypothetical protein